MSSPARDEIALREASIADARRELADGEMSPEQFAALLARERAAIARCEESLATNRAAPSALVPERRRHRRGYLYVALGCFTVAVVASLVAALALRQPGESVSGGVSVATAQRVSQDLADGEIDQVNKDDAAALAAYESVLALEPSNIEALTQSGWLAFSAGSHDHDVAVVRLGDQQLAKAVNLAPTDPDPRLYYAIVAVSTPGERALATREFRLFLTLRPSTELLGVARPWLEALGLPTR